jgi:hypothetical protein
MLSGFGLRPLRAFLVLALVIGLSALGFQKFGLETSHGYLSALAFSMESSLSLLRTPSEALTLGGRFLSIGARIAGPALLALGILAIRTRVKR